MTVRWSRRQFLGRSAALAVAAAGVGPLLAACGGDDDDVGAAAAVAAAVAPTRSPVRPRTR